MGIAYLDAKALWQARLRGVSFQETLMVARLSLFLHPDEIQEFRTVHHARFPQEAPLSNLKFGDHSDAFLKEILGVQTLSVLDFSTYEGATVVHDLNQPVPENLYRRFDAIVDGGTLEHVFNFPVSIANLMNMLKVGGHLFLALPANNLCGHGFYQFSPELMYRLFAPENGFQLENVLFYEAKYPSIELTRNRVTYRVEDPKNIGGRVGLLNSKPTILLVEAVKTSDIVPFTKPPLQSDYVVRWEGQSNSGGTNWRQFAKRILEKLPAPLQVRLRGFRERKQLSLKNRSFYQKIRDSL